MTAAVTPLRARWLGRVRYRDALVLQRALHDSRQADYLLLLEHPHVYTLGVRTKPEHLLASAATSGAEIVRADRGGDVTYHGPGQLVGYPIVDVPIGPGAIPAFVRRIEQLVIDVLADVGLDGAGRLEGYPGVWVGRGTPEPRKICAVGVRVERGRSLHGFALNVNPDLSMFGHIVPCGIADKSVTSLAAEGVVCSTAEVVDAVAARAGSAFCFEPGGRRPVDRQDAARPTVAVAPAPVPPAPVPAPVAVSPAARSLRALDRRIEAAGVDLSKAVGIRERKPEWVRVQARFGPEVLSLRSTIRRHGLVTVCEEAGCPNLSECWADGTATFMINGDRCTRACGFCLVDTRHPMQLDATEPERVAEAVASMDLAHSVVTAVARDDLADGGAAAFAATIRAIRRHSPTTAIEVLIPDCKGDPEALELIFAERPDVLNHNIETVNRLQRAVRPSASYARSLAVLARAKRAGLVTKSGLIVGMGEEPAEVRAALADLRAVGVDIVTIGQYLRPSAAHLPVVRWWRPEELEEMGAVGRAMGFGHVEASPLTRSSYHARQATAGVRQDAAAASVSALSGS